MQVADLIGNQTITPAMARYLETSVKNKSNIIVFGAATTGKTGTLKALSSFIPDDDRVVVIQDHPEIVLHHSQVLSLKAITDNGRRVTPDLVRYALSLKPDRLILGQMDGKEAAEILQGIGAGFRGVLTTMHAHSLRDILVRFQNMVHGGGPDSPEGHAEKAGTAGLCVAVQQVRMPDGSRRINRITKVVDVTDGVFRIEDVFANSEYVGGESGCSYLTRPSTNMLTGFPLR